MDRMRDMPSFSIKLWTKLQKGYRLIMLGRNGLAYNLFFKQNLKYKIYHKTWLLDCVWMYVCE